jgi:hypothetical protein
MHFDIGSAVTKAARRSPGTKAAPPPARDHDAQM